MNATRKLVVLFAAAVLLVVVMMLASFQAFRQVETDAAARYDTTLDALKQLHALAPLHEFKEINQRELAQRDADFQASLRRLFGVIVTASVFTLLFALLFIYLIYRNAQNRVAKLVQHETQRLLEVQEELNRELQEANGTLRLNEEKLTVTLNSIGDAVITTDALGRVTFLNPLAESLTGWPREEAVGRSVEDVFHIIDRTPASLPPSR